MTLEYIVFDLISTYPFPELMERIWKFSFVLQYNKGWEFDLHNFLGNYDTSSIHVKTQG